MPLTKEERTILEDIRDSQVEQRTVLLGIPDTDDRGLVGEVKNIKLSVNSNTKSISKVKVTLAALIGSGVIGTGIWQVVGCINGG